MTSSQCSFSLRTATGKVDVRTAVVTTVLPDGTTRTITRPAQLERLEQRAHGRLLLTVTSAAGDAVRVLSRQATWAALPAATPAVSTLLGDPVVAALRDVFGAAGKQLFAVGGPVRDALRGVVDVADLDFTSDARPEELVAILGPLGALWTAGERFGTIAVQVKVPGRPPMKVEVTTFRKEVYDADSRKPAVGFGDNIGDDLRRRDLTVNAVALDVHTGVLFDPLGGAAALAARVLDTPDDPVRTISEDPLRALRALRFTAKLDAVLAPRLAAAIRQCAPRLSIVAVERRADELRKILSAGSGREQALRLAVQLQVAPYLLGELVVGEPVLAALALLPGQGDALAALAAATGPGARAAMRGLRLSSDEIADATGVAEAAAALVAANVALTGGTVDDAPVRALLRAHDDDAWARAARVAGALGRPTAAVTDAMAAMVVAEPGVRGPLPLGGDDLVELGLSGPPVGAALRALEAAWCARGPLTRTDALAVLAL